MPSRSGSARRARGPTCPRLDIYLAGGGQLAGELVSEIDRLLVKLYPVVAGAGRTAFGTRFAPTHFDLDEVRTFAGGNALLQYSRRP